MDGSIEPARVETPLGRLAVHELGAGLPTVLWHPLLVDASSWGYVIPRLLAGRRLLLVDGPGWGRSDRLPRSARPADVVRAAAVLIERLAPEAAVDWVGAGWGGRIGVELAVTRPELVRSLVAISSPFGRMDPARRRTLQRTLAGLRVIGPVGPVGRAIVADQLSPASRTEPQTVGGVLDALMLAGRLAAAGSVTRFEVRRPDLTDLLPAVMVPSLFVASGSGDWPVTEAEQAAALAPLARAVVVPESGTLIALDRPGELSDLITAFWSTLSDQIRDV